MFEPTRREMNKSSRSAKQDTTTTPATTNNQITAVSHPARWNLIPVALIKDDRVFRLSLSLSLSPQEILSCLRHEDFFFVGGSPAVKDLLADDGPAHSLTFDYVISFSFCPLVLRVDGFGHQRSFFRPIKVMYILQTLAGFDMGHFGRAMKSSYLPNLTCLPISFLLPG